MDQQHPPPSAEPARRKRPRTTPLRAGTELDGRRNNRPPLKPISEDEPTVSYGLRITLSLRQKLVALGGAAWLRDQIAAADAASDPRWMPRRRRLIPRSGAAAAQRGIFAGGKLFKRRDQRGDPPTPPASAAPS